VADKTEKQVSVLSENSEGGFYDGLMQNFWVAELADEAKEMEGTDIAAPQPGTTQTIMVRRKVFDLVGLINPAMRHRDTMDWILRSKKAGIKSRRLDEILVHLRLHKNNRCRSRAKNDAEDLFAIIQG
jgi:hypothetical protein